MALPPYWWREAKHLQAEYRKHGSLSAIANAHPGEISHRALVTWWGKLGLPPLPKGPRSEAFVPAGGEMDNDDEWLLEALKKAKGKATVEELADLANVAPRHVREGLERLNDRGYRVERGEQHVVLERVPPQKDNLHQALFDGNEVSVGVVSDTHLGANEEALEELHLAYDIFQKKGIREVWHAGDWGTGVGMFRTHHSEAHVHTADEQVEYLVENYPRRKGIVTRGISGNHDIEGEFGKAGFDPVAALANKRDDIDYLGIYSAYLETKPESGKWIHLLHGSGGMSYSWSYKAQKIVDRYPSGRKPSALIIGHWHVRGNIRTRDVEVLWPGCFEWQSYFMARLGLVPEIGFHILNMTVADDGSIVRWAPEWFPYYEGRKVKAA